MTMVGDAEASVLVSLAAAPCVGLDTLRRVLASPEWSLSSGWLMLPPPHGDRPPVPISLWVSAAFRDGSSIEFRFREEGGCATIASLKQRRLAQ